MSLPVPIQVALQRGVVIPAHPLALTAGRKLDERRQRALSRYYIAAGAGGLAVAVHTTQFEIRNPEVGLFKPVLELAAEEMSRADRDRATPLVRIGGICGRARQALDEAHALADLGYHAGLLSLGALKDATEQQLLDHCAGVAKVLPIVGFYLQPSVGGRVLPYSFWRRFAEIENVVAIKIAPFNRYQTLDVVRAVIESGRDDVALYTGNDDNIVLDLLTPYRFLKPIKPAAAADRDDEDAVGGRAPSSTAGGHLSPPGATQAPAAESHEPHLVPAEWHERRIVGGLLGHWSVWTKRAVELLRVCHQEVKAGQGVSPMMLRRAIEVTDSNAAFFDPAHHFAGCIAGLHEVLRRQGLLEGIWCLNPNETLSPGQKDEIDRVYRMYPHLNDDAFVAQHRDEWLRG